jgi:osmotically-inducible protein OsmY
MDTDLKLRKRVIQELEWEPSIDPTRMTVDVTDGVVSLTGTVSNHAQKRVAENAVKRVSGVRAVVEGLEVRLPDESVRSDAAIAEAAAHALEWDVRVPHERVSITVEKGVVTLEGSVDWQYQRNAAARAMSRLTGVMGVVNLLHVAPPVAATDLKGEVESALERNTHVDAAGIYVEAIGNKIVLRGAVNAWHEREEAERIAWAAPGVAAVENELVVRVPAVMGAAAATGSRIP